MAGNIKTTAALSNPTGGGSEPAGLRSQILGYARQRLGPEGAKVINAILETEGGLGGAVGDNGQSYGPFQFYKGGQLGNLAQQLGATEDRAGAWVLANAYAAAQWAIDGYLGNVIRAGQQKGLSGANLATYAQDKGQVSITPERAGQNYNLLDSIAGLGATTASAAGPDEDPADAYFTQLEADAANNAAIGSRPPDTSSGAEPSASGAAPATSTYIEQINAVKGKPTKTQTSAAMVSNPDIQTRGLTPQISNPNPQYRYTWPDGTYAVVNANDEILGGNALSDISKTTATKGLSRFTGPDGYSYTFDPNTGKTVRDESVGTAAPKADTAPPSIVSVGGKAFKWQKGRDAAWALYPVAELNDPNYQPPGYRTPAQQAQDAATLTGTNLANQQGQLAIMKAQAQAKSDELWKQVSTGQMRPQDATSNFGEWWKINVEAPQAKADLVSTITSQQKELASYRVGPNFEAHFDETLRDQTAPGGGSGKTSFAPGDFTFKMEDPSKIAERMTLEALQGISPLAAQRLAKMGGGQSSSSGSPQQDYGAGSYTPPSGSSSYVPQLSTVEPVKFPNYVPEPVRAAQDLMARNPAPLPYAGAGGEYQDDPSLTPEENMRRRYAQLSPYLPGG